jgi:diguanylate cyclase (GGDEF)-like protein
MSLELADMDGITACQILTTTPGISNVPVIMLAGTSDDVSRLDAAFDAGAFDFVSEPCQPRELHARIRASIRLKQEVDARQERERELEEALKAQRVLSQRTASANEFLRHQGGLDPLTNIANRGRFDDTLLFQIRDAIRHSTNLTLVLLDIDHFKKYNDAYGHLAGDDCLKRVAGAISSSLQRTTDRAARYGGEEFAAILPDTEAKGAMIVAERIRANVEALGIAHKASNTSSVVTVSLGVTSFSPSRDDTPEIYIQQSDSALYKSKEAGRNRVTLHTKPA